MAARNLSQEAHLWYTVVSLDYITGARDKLQQAFDFMQARVLKHPFISGYAPVPHWGGVMEDLLDRFAHAAATLKHGDFGAMQSWASRVQDIPRGFQESNLEWLVPPDQDHFLGLLNSAYGICSSFSRALTMSEMYSSPGYRDGSGDWHTEIPHDLGIEADYIARHHEAEIFSVLPEQIPEYEADLSVNCKTGDVVPWTGVWVPSSGMGSAALAYARQGMQIMQPAYEVASVDEDGSPESYTLVECDWRPVKPTGRLIGHPLLLQLKQAEPRASRRCESGERCPREGWWFTPAEGGKRHFQIGEVMPHIGADYGLTIWQWDESQ